MNIIDLPLDNELLINQTAKVLYDAFQEQPPAWPTMDAATEEVRESLIEGRISRVAIDNNGAVLGWIGGQPIYDGHVWELHPLAVAPHAQRCGIGRELVEDLENQVVRRGGMTLWLGSDDEDCRTSLGGIDLYPNPLEHLANIKNCAVIRTSFIRSWALSFAACCRTPTARVSQTFF